MVNGIKILMSDELKMNVALNFLTKPKVSKFVLVYHVARSLNKTKKKTLEISMNCVAFCSVILV